ncbi:MAG: hypothetical protein LQ341_007761, partial [Variospora aurantia]
RTAQCASEIFPVSIVIKTSPPSEIPRYDLNGLARSQLDELALDCHNAAAAILHQIAQRNDPTWYDPTLAEYLGLVSQTAQKVQQKRVKKKHKLRSKDLELCSSSKARRI